ncbi:hypothetical protein F5Y09DRAFT_299674 [Xylaria sp. FL1042]|nr:hypothetical protein F5Y09DRAFT_299674 [Xylaria sp. FL1042]
MRKTVHSNYRMTHMKADQRLDQWYDNLRELQGVSGKLLKFKYQAEYQAFINAAEGKRINELAKWSDEWLTKVTRVYSQGLKIYAFELITDLTKALQRSYPEWITTFRASHSEEITEDTLRYQDIATAMRREAIVLGMARSQPKGSRGFAPGGSFNTFTPGGEQEDANEPDSDDDERLPRQGTKRRRANTTRTQAEQENPNVSDCPICFGRHPATICWYAFPELRPDDWRPNPATERLARQRMRDDESAKRAYKRARKEVARLAMN